MSSGQVTSTLGNAQTPPSTYDDQSTSLREGGGDTLIHIHTSPLSLRLHQACQTNLLHLQRATNKTSRLHNKATQPQQSPMHEAYANCQCALRPSSPHSGNPLQWWPKATRVLLSKGGQLPVLPFPGHVSLPLLCAIYAPQKPCCLTTPHLGNNTAHPAATTAA